MKGLTKLKNSREFLQSIFLQNLSPGLLLNNKEKQKIKIKIVYLKKKLREIENKLIYQTIISLPYFSYEKLKKSKIKTIPFLNTITKILSLKSMGSKAPAIKLLTVSNNNYFSNKTLNNFIIEKYSITNYFYKKLYQIIKKNYKIASFIPKNNKENLSNIQILKNKNFNKRPHYNVVTNQHTCEEYFNILKYYQKNVRYLYSIDQLKYSVTKRQTFSKKSSEFNQQLKEKKKISILYGFLPKKQIGKIYNKAFYIKGRTDNNIFFLLERRLDIVLYRACFFSTIQTVRQYITHKKITVNGQTVTLPNYILNPGDIISVKKSEFYKIDYHIKNYIKKYVKLSTSRFLVSNDIIQKLQNFLVSSNNLSYYQKMKSLIYLKNNINLILTNKKILHNKHKSIINNEKKSLIFVLSLLKYFKDKSYNFSKNFYLYLKLKEKLFKKRSRRQYLFALRLNQMKPLNLEISYKSLTIIFLYCPQKLKFSALLDIDKITRSINLFNRKNK